MHSAVHFCDQQ